jgi:hypothetical protein
MTRTEVEAWAKAHPEEALGVALNVFAEQSSVIGPWTLHCTDDTGKPPMRVEVYKGEHAVARKAEVEAETRLHAAYRATAEA